MKVMFISKELNRVSGSAVAAKVHKECLEVVVGKENVFVVDLSQETSATETDNYISFDKYSNYFDRFIRNINGYTYDLSVKIVDKICSIIRREQISFVFIDDSTYGKLVEAIKKSSPSVKVVSFFHDVKANLYPIWMSRESNFLKTIDMRIGLINEKISVNAVDANIVLNNNENRLLQRYYGKKAEYFFPVCVPKDTSEYKNVYVDNGKKHILFVGTSYYPNVVACKWFYTQVFPKISDKFDFYIVGKGLEILREDICDKDVHVVGFVDSIAPYYQYCDCVIAPLTDGGGMKIKTAEAFSYGKIFLGSEESLQGYYECIPEKMLEYIVYKCSTEEDYINALNRLQDLKLDSNNQELIEFFNSNYSTEAAIDIMKRILEEVTDSGDVVRGEKAK